MKYNFDYQTILNSLPHAVLMTDLNQKMIFANNACIELYDLDPGDYIGKSCTEIQTACGNLENNIENERKGISADCDCFIDNRGRSIHIMASLLYDSDNTHIGYIITSVDVTELKAAEMNLKISDERFRIAIPHTKSGIWEYDPIKKTLIRETESNPMFRIPEIAYNMPHSMIDSGLIHPDSVQDFHKLFNDLDNGANYTEAEIKMLTNDKQIIWFRWVFTNIFNSKHKPIKAIGVSSDITSKKEIEIRANQDRQYLESLVSGAISVFEINLTRNELERSSVSGCESFRGSDICYHLLKSGMYWNVVEADVQQLEFMFSTQNLTNLFHKGIREVKHEYRCQNTHREYWVRAEANLVGPGADGEIYAFILVKNINAQKESEQALRKKASQDPLTGLYNREFARERITEVITSPRRSNKVCCMYIIDIDDFKLINDNFGHIVGDNFIIGLADTLASFFRKDDIICRLGGDEFMVFVPDITKSMAAKKADMLNKVLISQDMKQKSGYLTSISIGLAFLEDEILNFNELYDRADRALYEAKNKGKNQYAIFEQEECLEYV